MAGAYTATLLFFSLYKITPEFEVGGFSVTDKMLHASAYLMLFVFWNLAFFLKSNTETAYKSTVVKISLACIAFGMLIEVLQGTLTSYRQADWWDVVANSTGVLIASFLFLAFEGPLKKVKN
ncbi:VanZ family protein [Zunongwangia sp. HGR-M22]|uniref:VanZ family protein n=1 Tax=Zunongwangia sp. HGR-M22 TaxID=3015168 RepID=UPI0022DDC269|nr:VanZ family protein [Zunongwangia sp. HGR-M22]WBL26037.1 VanZ family protein [Zunongwangia sp. HGR-M22]